MMKPIRTVRCLDINLDNCVFTMIGLIFPMFCAFLFQIIAKFKVILIITAQL